MPGDAEGMGCVESDGGNVGEDVAAGGCGPGSADVEGCAAGAAFEGRDVDLGVAVAGEVIVDYSEDAEGSFG